MLCAAEVLSIMRLLSSFFLAIQWQKLAQTRSYVDSNWVLAKLKRFDDTTYRIFLISIRGH